MFELPLPPFCNAYGQAQRRLAREFGAYLIPKRIFAGVLTRAGSTADGIHLSPKGHGEMAAIAANVLHRAIPSP
jgi:lysophospholipase L1-like esterase